MNDVIYYWKGGSFVVYDLVTEMWEHADDVAEALRLVESEAGDRELGTVATAFLSDGGRDAWLEFTLRKSGWTLDGIGPGKDDRGCKVRFAEPGR